MASGDGAITPRADSGDLPSGKRGFSPVELLFPLQVGSPSAMTIVRIFLEKCLRIENSEGMMGRN